MIALKFTGQLHGQNLHLVRIDKRKARNLFNKGIEIYLCPSNLNPVLFGNKPFKIEYSCGADFEQIVRSVEYFFCINAKTGYFPSYYINTLKP
jgi:hypothetical protein